MEIYTFDDEIFSDTSQDNDRSGDFIVNELDCSLKTAPGHEIVLLKVKLIQIYFISASIGQVIRMNDEYAEFTSEM